MVGYASSKMLMTQGVETDDYSIHDQHGGAENPDFFNTS